MTKQELLQLIEYGRFYHTQFETGLGRPVLRCNECHRPISSGSYHALDCLRGKYEAARDKALVQKAKQIRRGE